jgi:hypothetical protein
MTSLRSRLCSGALIVLCGLAGALSAPPVMAQQVLVLKDLSWGIFQIGSDCGFVAHVASRREVTWGGRDIKYSWSGPCDSEGLIEGQGVLTVDFVVPARQWDALSGVPQNEWKATPRKYRIKASGTAVAGIFEGATSIAELWDGDDRNDATPPGSMQLQPQDYFDLDERNPRPYFFRNGCAYPTDASGAVVNGSKPLLGCNPGGGQRLLEFWRTGKNDEFERRYLDE